MDEMRTRTGRIDQIVFRWTARSLIGHSGVGPDATSLDDGEMRRWDELLALRITRASDGNAEPSFAFLRFDDQAVILHKVPARDDKNRRGAAVAHALIGDADLVDVGLALGLEHWPGWAGYSPERYPPGRLPVLDHQALREDAEVARERLRAADPGACFDELLSFQLADPAAPATIVMPGAPATALISGLVDVLGPGDWTFATNEDDDTAPDLPRLVFLDAVPRGSGYASTRHRVVIGGPGSAPGEFAVQLADLRRREGARAVAAVRGGRVLRSVVDVARWQDEVLVRGHLLTGNLIDAVTFGRPARAHRELLSSPEGLDQVRTELSAIGKDSALKAVYEAWQDGSPLAREHPAVAALVQAETLRRCLRVGASAALLEAVRRSRVDLDLLDDRVRQWASAPRNAAAAPDRIVELAQLVLGLGLPADPRRPGLRALLGRLSLPDVIRLADKSTVKAPDVAVLLLRAVEVRAHVPDERNAAQVALEQTEYLMHCIPRLTRDARVAADHWCHVLEAAFGTSISTDRRVMNDIQAYVSRDGAGEVEPAFGYALRQFAEDVEAKAAVDQLAARDRYLAVGLPDIWPERREMRAAMAVRARPPGTRVVRLTPTVDATVYRQRAGLRSLPPWLLVVAPIAVLVLVAVVGWISGAWL